MKPKRIQLSRKKGFKLPPNTVVVSRPSKWGNPFCVSDVLDFYDGVAAMAHADCVRSFCQMLKEGKTPPFALANIREELRGKNLACWCKSGMPCHADVLLRVANV
jgi:hypothetical protein